MALNSDQCLAPVACDSPALALARRPRLQLSHDVPHDSATSLVRLDTHLLPSPLSKGVSFAALGNFDDPHASPHPHGSLGARMWPCGMSDGHQSCVKKGPPPQLSLGTRVVPMIISPDDHHEMQCQVCICCTESHSPYTSAAWGFIGSLPEYISLFGHYVFTGTYLLVGLLYIMYLVTSCL